MPANLHIINAWAETNWCIFSLWWVEHYLSPASYQSLIGWASTGNNWWRHCCFATSLVLRYGMTSRLSCPFEVAVEKLRRPKEWARQTGTVGQSNHQSQGGMYVVRTEVDRATRGADQHESHFRNPDAQNHGSDERLENSFGHRPANAANSSKNRKTALYSFSDVHLHCPESI